MKEQVPALRMIGLHKAFRETVAVGHVDLTVLPGSFFGLVGPNGAGKTAALSVAVGLLRRMPAVRKFRWKAAWRGGHSRRAARRRKASRRPGLW
jgi:ABC-2 type transport system ATP-binding protein